MLRRLPTGRLDGVHLVDAKQQCPRRRLGASVVAEGCLELRLDEMAFPSQSAGARIGLKSKTLH